MTKENTQRRIRKEELEKEEKECMAVAEKKKGKKMNMVEKILAGYYPAMVSNLSLFICYADCGFAGTL